MDVPLCKLEAEGREFVTFSRHCTEVRFASFLSSGFTTMAVINPPEKKLAKRTSVHCSCSREVGKHVANIRLKKLSAALNKELL